MGLIPATGTAIQLSRVAGAYGLATTNAKVNATAVTAGLKTARQQTPLSATFGDQTTPNNYLFEY
jgi:hypothetical protein